jgi:hypothetical protein
MSSARMSIAVEPAGTEQRATAPQSGARLKRWLRPALGLVLPVGVAVL